MQYNNNAPDRRDRALQVVLHVAPIQHYSASSLSVASLAYSSTSSQPLKSRPRL